MSKGNIQNLIKRKYEPFGRKTKINRGKMKEERNHRFLHRSEENGKSIKTKTSYCKEKQGNFIGDYDEMLEK